MTDKVKAELIKEIKLLRKRIAEFETADRQHKQAAKELRVSKERYRKQFEEATDAIFIADPKTGILLDCNFAAAALVERDKSEIIGKHQRFLHPAEDVRERVSKTFKKHVKDNPSELADDRVITKSGQIKDVAIKASKITIEGKELMQGIFRDITERKKTEEALRYSEVKFRRLFESMMEACATTDMAGHILEANSVFQAMVGYADSELRQLNFWDLTPKKWHAFEDRIVQEQVFKRGYSDVYEKEYRKKDGTIVPIELRTFLIRDVAGQPSGMWAIVRDITERKKTEEEILFLSKFPSENPSPVLRIAKDGVILYSNKAGLELLAHWGVKVGQKAPEKWQGLIKEALESAKTGLQEEEEEEEEEEEVKDKIFLVIIAPVVEAGYVNLYARNITERKKAEEKLKKSEQELHEDKLAMEQKNLAFKELLEHMEREKNKTKEDIAINVEELMMPILRKLEIKGAPAKYIKLLEHHLKELVSSFGRKITQKSAKLTSREIEICSMIKGGLASKDISDLLNVSCQTIEKHRKNIRKKLGLSNKKANLTSHLHKI